VETRSETLYADKSDLTLFRSVLRSVKLQGLGLLLEGIAGGRLVKVADGCVVLILAVLTTTISRKIKHILSILLRLFERSANGRELSRKDE
jgi:hypothetical protein